MKDCSSVWHPYLKKDIIKLEKIQRRATKLIPNLKNLSYMERLKKLNLPTLSYRRNRADMIQTFKIIQGIDELECTNFFKLDTQSRTRGHSRKLTKLRAHSTLRQRDFSQRVVNLWNDLPTEVVNSSSINAFKSNLEKAWKTKFNRFDPDTEFP